MRPYRWIPHDGNRHAVTVALGPGDHALTLCGLPLDIPAEPPRRGRTAVGRSAPRATSSGG